MFKKEYIELFSTIQHKQKKENLSHTTVLSLHQFCNICKVKCAIQ